MMLRLLGIILVTGGLMAVESGGTPLEPLPPEAVRSPMKPGTGTGNEKVARAINVSALSGELKLLVEIRERVRQRLRDGLIPGGTADDAEALEPIEDERQGVGVDAIESVEESHHLKLKVTTFTSGAKRVSASIRRERVQVVYNELLTRLGRSIDDQQVGNVRRRISFHVDDMPWEQALTALLGQAGLGWRVTGERVQLYELSREPRQRVDNRLLAEQSFDQALGGSDDVSAAQAAYLLGRREQDDRHLYAAMGRYYEVLERFGEDENPAIGLWVAKARRGIGDVLMTMQEYGEAKTIYLNYISQAPKDDPALPHVKLDAATALRRLGTGAAGRKADVAASERAKDQLLAIIQDYQDDPELEGIVAEARINLGELYFEGQAYGLAQEYFEAYRSMLGPRMSDQLRWYLAECDYHLGIQAKRRREFAVADALLLKARKRYETLTDHLRKNRIDQAVGMEIYEESFFKMGKCNLELSQPRFVEALFDFLRARQQFADKPLEGRVLVHICHCYAELQRDEQHIKELYAFLENDSLTNQMSPKEVVDNLLGNTSLNLSEYSGKVRQKVLFYIATAFARESRWNDQQRVNLLRRAVGVYERVLKLDGVPGDLKMATKIGLARAALGSGEGDKALAHLNEVVRSKDAHPRDSALAVQILLDYYRSQGRYTEVIERYQAFSETVAE